LFPINLERQGRLLEVIFSRTQLAEFNFRFDSDPRLQNFLNSAPVGRWSGGGVGDFLKKERNYSKDGEFNPK